ncbi:hypothetical protein HT031_006826 [Scenedesmus sp. PABB004]|nr:hypothetical protein HT031_006826 [Scenedesmus sp. PABB004]
MTQQGRRRPAAARRAPPSGRVAGGAGGAGGAALVPAAAGGGARVRRELLAPVVAHSAAERSSGAAAAAPSAAPRDPGGGGGGAPERRAPRSAREILRSAGARALGGGLPGASAMVVQVLALMWLRTTVNYQYRTGASPRAALAALYADGGLRRFYRGVGPALLQGPLCRFGDTAANAGVLSVLGELEATRRLPLGVQTAAASLAAGAWRMLLLPLDAAKTMMQVEGAAGLRHLGAKVRAHGPSVLYHGAGASAAATVVGHWPWFSTYNYLNGALPLPDSLGGRLLRSAGIGFAAGVAADVCSNGVRVVKTTRQTARETMSYRDAVASVVASDGVAGLWTRGLSTRIAANGLQNMMFTVLWTLGQDRFSRWAGAPP